MTTSDKPKVILKDQKTYDADAITNKASEAIEELGLDVRGKSVFVKPSFVYPSKDPIVMGIITQPEVLVGTLRALKDAGASRIMVGESKMRYRIGPVTFKRREMELAMLSVLWGSCCMLLWATPWVSKGSHASGILPGALAPGGALRALLAPPTRV